jgi:ABC-type dipeptide/oligopeptide/nickel transport system ATPase component
MTMASDNAGLIVRGLTTTFDTARGTAIAAADVDFDVAPGEVVGLVGESGSGKSVTLRSIMRLIREPGHVRGRVEWGGRDLVAMSDEELRRIRGSEIAMIFQEPMTALNPVLPVGQQIEESLVAHTGLNRRERQARALELMNIVGIPAAERRLGEYPHQFSGGMRQRAMIAIALACSPKLLLADEPTTAPDPETAARPSRPARHERGAGHSRPRRRRCDLRPHGGDVCRSDCRDRHRR